MFPHVLNGPVGIDVRLVVRHGLSVKILEQWTGAVTPTFSLFKVLVIGRDPVERVFMVQKDDPGLESSSVGHQVSMRHGMFHLVVVERAAPPQERGHVRNGRAIRATRAFRLQGCFPARRAPRRSSVGTSAPPSEGLSAAVKKNDVQHRTKIQWYVEQRVQESEPAGPWHAPNPREHAVARPGAPGPSARHGPHSLTRHARTRRWSSVRFNLVLFDNCLVRCVWLSFVARSRARWAPSGAEPELREFSRC